MRFAKFALTGLLITGVALTAVVPASAAVGVFVGRGYGPRPWVRPWYGPRVGFYFGAPLYYPYPYPYAYPYGYSPPPPPPAYYDGPTPRDYGPSPSVQPQENSWYYCRDPEGYYPYVQDCRGEWEAVPASPQNSEPPPQDVPPRRLQP